MKNKLQRMILYIFIGYITSGFIYSIVGIIYRGNQGRETVISPILGIPMDIIGWPWMVYADLKHIGVMPQDVAVLLTIAAFIVVYLAKNRSNM